MSVSTPGPRSKLVSSAGWIPTAQLQRSLRGLRRAERVQKWRAFALVAPLLLFLVVTFVLPIGAMLLRSVQDPELGAVLPRTAQALRQWNESALPDARLVEIFAAEMVAGRQAGTLSAAANRLNYDVNGFRTLLLRTARQLGTGTASIEALAAIDPRWAHRETWAAMRQAAGPYTSFYLLAALDRPGTWTARSSRPRRIRRSTATCSPAPSPSASASPSALPDPGLPGRLPAGDAAGRPVEPADDLRPAAFLDFASGPDTAPGSCCCSARAW